MKSNQHRIRFEAEEEILCAVMAQLGRSTAAISMATKLSPGQVDYRIGKAKRLLGLPSGQGFRTQWRLGIGPAVEEVERHCLDRLIRQAERELPPLIGRPTPKTVAA